MKRLFLLLTLSVFLLSSCAEVTYLPLSPPTVKIIEATPTALPANTPTPIPPTQPPDLGVSTEALRGLGVELWHGLDGIQASLLAQMAAEFSLANPWGITLRARGWGNLARLEQAVAEGKTGARLPELALAMPEQALAWDEEALLTPLDPYFSNPEFGFTQADLNDFPASIWRQDHVNDRRLGAPAMRSTRLLFYNQTWARELGFENPPQTTPDFRAQACAANATFRLDADPGNDGLGGLILDGNPWTAYSWLRAFGGDVAEDDRLDFEREENIAALNFLSGLRASGCAWMTTDLTSYHHLAARRALFITGSLSEIAAQNSAWQAAGNSDEWTVIPFPGLNRVAVAYGPSFMMFESSPARQLAGWLFARWILSAENQARWAQESGLLPARVSALAMVRNPSAQWRSAADLVPQMSNYPQRADWRVARRALGDGFFTFFILGLSPEEVLAEMQTAVEEATAP